MNTMEDEDVKISFATTNTEEDEKVKIFVTTMIKEEDKDIEVPSYIQGPSPLGVYRRKQFLGKGTFGTCYELFNIYTKKSFAGKIFSTKTVLSRNYWREMINEITLQKHLNHKHVTRLFDFFMDSKFVYLILELSPKRSMLELFKKRKILTEHEVRYYLNQISEGVLYIHHNNIIHRDLKLANIFLSDNLEVKIGDFGLATRVEAPGELKREKCGTPHYMAPEIIMGEGYSYEVDVWSIGCILYALLIGKSPFNTICLVDLKKKILSGDYNLPEHLPTATATMLQQMLSLDPSKRPKVGDFLKMEFMRKRFPRKLPAESLETEPKFARRKRKRDSEDDESFE